MRSLNKESGIKCVCCGRLAYPGSAGEDCCFAAHIVNEVNGFNFVALGLLLRWRVNLCTGVWEGTNDGTFLLLRCNLTGCRPRQGTPFFSFPKTYAIITTKALHFKKNLEKVGHNVLLIWRNLVFWHFLHLNLGIFKYIFYFSTDFVLTVWLCSALKQNWPFNKKDMFFGWKSSIA